MLVPIDQRSNTVREAYRPERRNVWPQQVVWLPAGAARTYGALGEGLRDAFGHEPPARSAALLLHPQAPAAHRRLAAAYGCATLPEVRATPTASYRSVLAWREGRPAVVLKLSLGAVVGRIRRALKEPQVARGVIMSRVFETIPIEARERLGFDWFPEPAGAVDAVSGRGWLLRRLPAALDGQGRCSLLPHFSLISTRDGRSPLLVDLIRASALGPEDYVLEKLVRPYVEALSYLLFEEGIQVEGHSQNVLLEIDEHDRPTGRLVFRDLSDATVSIPMRLARGKPLPGFAPGFLSERAPFPLASIAADYHCNFARRWLFRAFDTVERYGLWGFVWPINTSLARFFGGYDAARVEHAYLALWQEAAVRALGVRPLFRDRPQGLATDETLAYWLRAVDWKGLGAVDGASLPAAAEPLLVERRQRRRAGAVYARLDCGWGELFLSGGLPAFFRPAF